MLKKNRPIKTLRSTQRGYEKEGEITPYRPEIRLCLERARLLTEGYKQTEGEAMVMKKARALENVLKNMTLYIDEGQLITGNYAAQKFN